VRANERQASKRREQLRKEYKSCSDELYRELGLYQTTLELQGLADYVLRRQTKERQAVIEAELEPIRAKEWQAYEQCNNEFRKQERYCKEQRDVLRALEDLEAKERTMYELDHRKDQVMKVCKVALANLAMWTRDQYFLPRMLMQRGSVCSRSFNPPARLHTMLPRFRCNSLLLTIARSIAI
jgi:hypothetical protein